MAALGDAAEVGEALGDARLLSGAGQRGQQDGDQHGDDGHDDEQFDERKPCYEKRLRFRGVGPRGAGGGHGAKAVHVERLQRGELARPTRSRAVIVADSRVSGDTFVPEQERRWYWSAA